MNRKEVITNQALYDQCNNLKRAKRNQVTGKYNEAIGAVIEDKDWREIEKSKLSEEIERSCHILKSKNINNKKIFKQVQKMIAFNANRINGITTGEAVSGTKGEIVEGII